jgi:ABC-2 type transport system permease protein
MGPNFALLIGNMIAMLLLGMAFIAIGIFVSSLTENQFAAAIITIGILLGLLLINVFSSIIKVNFIRTILSFLSVYGRFENFSRGLFDFSAIIYYFSISGIFLFLTVRVFESRRYR